MLNVRLLKLLFLSNQNLDRAVVSFASPLYTKVSNLVSNNKFKFTLFIHGNGNINGNNNQIAKCSQQHCKFSNASNQEPGSPSPTEEPPHKSKPRMLPILMSFPEIVWPSILKTIKNWILINFIVKPYFDNDFDTQDFVDGTKQALQVISNSLADGDINSLNKLVAPEVIDELKAKISKFSLSQRFELGIKKEDIYLTFPYQVGIMFDESTEVQKRYVEITMVFHVLRGLDEMQSRGQNPPLNMGVLPEYRDKVSICNYRFIKEFTQGNQSDWTVNIVNHFKPSDYITDS